ncbi:unnamed protein product [Miscanthus lutarioriparius]|uniref:DNA2/NAM7 helicase-like C-terminal domain-containing protein n=1 Tax=Miscanthus lutarioriparius TaxID=422564 RepID=A0A811PSE5_9POAL|nr:unnamed protein product [Miscanthus lutarioriparius]
MAFHVGTRSSWDRENPYCYQHYYAALLKKLAPESYKQLKGREQQLSQEIAYLQRELNMVAAAQLVDRSQGSVGVDPDVLAQRDRNRDILLQKLAALVESRDKILVEMSQLLILEIRNAKTDLQLCQVAGNIHEAQFTLRLYEAMAYEHLQKFLKANGAKKVSVGIITPYKLQLKCLQQEIKDVMNTKEGEDTYINTVDDAFQGQERDVIIMSCVRASNHGVGFVADIQCMNVALTQARRALWVVGNANTLMQSEDWAALIADAKARKCFMDLDSILKDFLPMKVPSNTPGRNSSNNIRNMRTGGGPRQDNWTCSQNRGLVHEHEAG